MNTPTGKEIVEQIDPYISEIVPAQKLERIYKCIDSAFEKYANQSKGAGCWVMERQKLIKLLQQFIGATPKDVGCQNWNDMSQLLSDEILKLATPSVKVSGGMDAITIYKFQLETIVEALRLTNNYNDSGKGATCYDRQVRQAYEFAKNALSGEKDKKVPYMAQQSTPTSSGMDMESAKHYAGLGWDAGAQYEYNQHFGVVPNNAPNKKTFLFSLPPVQEAPQSLPVTGEDGWVSDKPELNKECILIVAGETFDEGFEYTSFRIVWHPENYWAICTMDGQEWGDYEDLEGVKYKIIDTPHLKNQTP